MRYGRVIYWSKAGSTFVIEVAELPGCMADGATYEMAVAITSEWLEAALVMGRTIPEPKGKLDFVES